MQAPATLLLLAGLGLLASAPASAQVTLRNLELKAHIDAYPPVGPCGGTSYSACWSYIHPDGREYAVIGVGDGHCDGGSSSEGTAIYNVTNPAAPHLVGFIPGPPSIWREMKQYRNWIYVVTEGTGAGEGIQIIRMTNPQKPVLAATHTGNFHRSHTVSVDTTRALLVCNGTRYKGEPPGAYYFAGTRILSLASPEAPVELSRWPNFTPPFGAQEESLYVHDSVPVGNRLYASSVYYGIQRVIDITDPASPVQLASWTYAGGFTHNAWPDASGNWLYVTDEKNGEPLKIFDISNLSSPVLFNLWNSNPIAIVHNAHVWGSELYLANYTEGIRVLDISDPGHPAEYGFADTYAGTSGGFNGVWEVCAQYPSGTIIASDRNSGLWVFRPVRNYGIQRVKVVDATNSQPIDGAQVFRGTNDSLTTTVDGVSVFASDPGTHTLIARRFGYFDASVSRATIVGGRDTVTMVLTPRPAVSFSGTIRDATTLLPLPDAEVVIAYSPLHDHSDGGGAFVFPSVPEGFYRVEVRCPGHIPVTFNRDIGPGNATMDFKLVPAPTYDPCESATGWSLGAAGDNAGSGQWVNVDPVGTSVGNSGSGFGSVIADGAGLLSLRSGGAAPAHEGHVEAFGLTPGAVQPEDDRSPAGTRCYVTGQGANSSDVAEADVDGGRTTLQTPPLDLTGMTIPTIGYWRWFYTNTGEATDYLAVLISNDDGSSWVPVDTTRARLGHWEEVAIRVTDYLSPTSQMRLQFIAADEGGKSVVEAAVDDLSLYDAATLPLGSYPYQGLVPSVLRLRPPWPNPANGVVHAVLELPATARVQAEVFDLQGRRVARVFDARAQAGTLVLTWDGADANGRPAEAGIYFVVARAGAETATARFVNLR